MSKAKGSRGERKVRKFLEAQGYAVTKAGASLGTWDLIAIRRDGVRLIQVKVGQKPYCPPHEIEQMELFECPPTVTRELWLWRDRAHLPEVRLIGKGSPPSSSY